MIYERCVLFIDEINRPFDQGINIFQADFMLKPFMKIESISKKRKKVWRKVFPFSLFFSFLSFICCLRAFMQSYPFFFFKAKLFSLTKWCIKFNICNSSSDLDYQLYPPLKVNDKKISSLYEIVDDQNFSKKN